MSDNPLKETIPSKLSEFLREQFAKNADIKRAALFGSRARGDHSEQSDFDVAVLDRYRKQTRTACAMRWNGKHQRCTKSTSFSMTIAMTKRSNKIS